MAWVESSAALTLRCVLDADNDVNGRRNSSRAHMLVLVWHACVNDVDVCVDAVDAFLFFPPPKARSKHKRIGVPVAYFCVCARLTCLQNYVFFFFAVVFCDVVLCDATTCDLAERREMSRDVRRSEVLRCDCMPAVLEVTGAWGEATSCGFMLCEEMVCWCWACVLFARDVMSCTGVSRAQRSRNLGQIANHRCVQYSLVP